MRSSRACLRPGTANEHVISGLHPLPAGRALAHAAAALWVCALTKVHFLEHLPQQVHVIHAQLQRLEGTAVVMPLQLEVHVR